jgi:hypothetical protein
MTRPSLLTRIIRRVAHETYFLTEEQSTTVLTEYTDDALALAFTEQHGDTLRRTEAWGWCRARATGQREAA